MTTYKCIFSVLLIFTFYRLDARNEQYEYILNNKDTVIKDVRLYGGLLHQHQDFLNKAFSYQGIEAGVVLNHKLLLGIFGGTFISNLNVNVAGNSLYMNIWKSGLVVGNVFRESKILHTGWLFNIGYFSLEHDNSNFELFNPQKSSAKINGLILMPELYAELNFAKWMKFRTGLAYSLYSFENQTLIKKKDLQNVSLNFGFIFGKFE
ncbi:MAG: hypothetical protein WBP08_17870 [Saprospiraceae bacterium]